MLGYHLLPFLTYSTAVLPLMPFAFIIYVPTVMHSTCNQDLSAGEGVAKLFMVLTMILIWLKGEV